MFQIDYVHVLRRMQRNIITSLIIKHYETLNFILKTMYCVRQATLHLNLAQMKEGFIKYVIQIRFRFSNDIRMS